MAKISHIVKKALKNVGIQVSEGDSVPGDIFNPTLGLLRDLIAELNSQSAIQFEQSSSVVPIQGSKLTFKLYTEAEQAIIDGGGTVDITDRLVDFVPINNPVVYIDGFHLEFVSYRDLLDRQEATNATCYAFNVGKDYSEIVFNAPVGGSITLLRSVPIEIDEEPFGEVHIPDSYVTYLVTRLSEAVAIHYQFHDTASVFAQKSERTGNILANNAASRKVVVKRNLTTGLNRFRKYGG